MTTPPRPGVLLLTSINQHVLIRFHDYTPTTENITEAYDDVIFYLEDTPSYISSPTEAATEILFIPGRPLGFSVDAFFMKNDAFSQFLFFLKSLGVSLANGIIQTTAAQSMFKLDVERYIRNLDLNVYIDKRVDWIQSNGLTLLSQVSVIPQSDGIDDKMKNSILYKGIEDDIRGKVWMRLLQVSDDETEFKNILEQVNHITQNQLKRSRELRKNFEQIEKDVGRTPIEGELLTNTKKSIEEIKNELRVLMKCWVVYYQDCGYQQGQSDVMVGIMEEVESMCGRFYVFERVMEILKSVYIVPIDINNIMAVLMEVLDDDVYCYMKMKKIGYSFVYKWIVLLFRRDFTPKKCKRIWDAIFAFKEKKLVFFIAAVMIIHNKRIILDNRFELDSLAIFFQELENHFDDGVVYDADIAYYTFMEKATPDQKKYFDKL
ncbi:hypothetical protein EIN_181560 [Entamoeba invadens IP1]|uniref:hypothetical protein n=1 Tax=Entamoeba invadens IP1 TaxID=370355 RepID=UPI0002C3F154|nr:hypothetical protein EIN_181560 [Entamoeba invadens IP1]ELP93989.1 hypothetical protein EIN_181560 [Entamoeba invadens IP1]|eukprot:XP_004260760.1 hypothetical protein EIN_181560 [Entamoeba invadens IP1]